MMICDLSGLNPSVSRTMGSLIAKNIRDLVLDQRTDPIEAEALQKRKEDKRKDMLLGSAYGTLLNIS